VGIKLERPFQLGIPGVDRIFVLVSSISRLWSLLKQDFDVVVLYAVPTYGFQTIVLSRLVGVPVVFRALDVSHKIRSTFLGPFIKLFERFVYRHSTIVSANNPAMEDYCALTAGQEINSVVNFPPLDIGHFSGTERDEALRLELGISKENQVVVYMGTFFYFSGLVAALRQFAKSAKDNVNLKFLLIGGGAQDRELRDLARFLDVEDSVIFTGFVSYKELPRYLALADVAVNTLVPSLVANVAFPNKVLQYLASKLHVASTPLEGLLSVFGESEDVSWGETPELVMKRALDFLAANRHDSIRKSSRLLSEKLSRFDPPIAVGQFENLLFTVSRDIK
jgi:glycosyltransferase involved in cell wall biosynthesis